MSPRHAHRQGPSPSPRAGEGRPVPPAAPLEVVRREGARALEGLRGVGEAPRSVERPAPVPVGLDALTLGASGRDGGRLEARHRVVDPVVVGREPRRAEGGLVGPAPASRAGHRVVGADRLVVPVGPRERAGGEEGVLVAVRRCPGGRGLAQRTCGLGVVPAHPVVACARGGGAAASARAPLPRRERRERRERLLVAGALDELRRARQRLDGRQGAPRRARASSARPRGRCRARRPRCAASSPPRPSRSPTPPGPARTAPRAGALDARRRVARPRAHRAGGAGRVPRREGLQGRVRSGRARRPRSSPRWRRRGRAPRRGGRCARGPARGADGCPWRARERARRGPRCSAAASAGSSSSRAARAPR
jgi:hypothetical protein